MRGSRGVAVMRDSWAHGTFRLGLLLMLTMGLVLPAFAPPGSAQGTPEGEPPAEPTATQAADSTAEPTTPPEPTGIVEPTVVPTDGPTTAPEPTAEPTTVEESTPEEVLSSRMGILADAPFTIETVGPATGRPGDTLTYTLTLTNTSGQPFQRVNMGGGLPGEFSWSIDPSQTTASCSIVDATLFLT